MKKTNIFLAMTTIAIFNFQLLTINSFAQYTKLLDFAGTSNGSFPYGSLISDGTFLYGMTYYGGTNDGGVIFKIMPDGSGYSKLLDFAGIANGARPYGDLVFDGTFLYGMSRIGGTGSCYPSSCGVLFKILPDGTGYSKLLDFTSIAKGSQPCGSLIFVGPFIYGMTSTGGTSTSCGSDGCGVIFKIMSDGTGYSKLLDLTGTANGSYPYGSLISDGTFLYGMTSLGGINDKGVVFKIKLDGTNYSKLHDFSGGTGGNPYGSLISDGTFLYGTASAGVSNGNGVIFKIKFDGTGYSVLHTFDPLGGSNGTYPFGSLTSDGTYLYGMTRDGGNLGCSTGCGVIFQIKPDGTGYSKLNFEGTTTGSNPSGSLISDGIYLYGMTYRSGANNKGTIFKYHPVGMGIDENNEDKAFEVYPNPSNGVFIIEISELQIQLQHNISVTNFLGEKVFQSEIKSQKAEIDLSKQPNGIYFINLKTEKGTAVQKLIIQK